MNWGRRNSAPSQRYDSDHISGTFTQIWTWQACPKAAQRDQSIGSLKLKNLLGLMPFHLWWKVVPQFGSYVSEWFQTECGRLNRWPQLETWWGFLETSAVDENMHACFLSMFNLCLCNSTTVQYSLSKLETCNSVASTEHCCCCKCNSFGCIEAMKCGNACHGLLKDSVCLATSTSNLIHQEDKIIPVLGPFISWFNDWPWLKFWRTNL